MSNNKWLAGILIGMLLLYLVVPVAPLIPLAIVIGKQVPPPLLQPVLRAYFYPLRTLSDKFPCYRKFFSLQMDFLNKLVE